MSKKKTQTHHIKNSYHSLTKSGNEMFATATIQHNHVQVQNATNQMLSQQLGALMQ